MGRNISQALQNLIQSISNETSLDSDLIAKLIKHHKIDLKDVEPFTTYDHPDSMSYGRELIFQNEHFKILLMSWKPGDFTAIHNHGETEWGCVCFFGDACHRLYSANNNELKLIKKDTLKKGQVVPVNGNLTHMMGNSSNKEFVTLHIYGANTQNKCASGVKVYLPEYQKTVTTSGSAYINMPSNLAISEQTSLKVQSDVALDYFQLVKPFYERNNNIALLNNFSNTLNHQNT